MITCPVARQTDVHTCTYMYLHSPGATVVKNPRVCRRHKKHRFDPWVGKILWRRKWQPTAVFLPGKSHGQRRLVGCSPWDHKESDTTEHAHILDLPPPIW